MKIFTLSWSWYEDYQYYQFCHESKTKQEFEDDVNTLIINYGKEYMEQEDSWVGIHSWVEYASKKLIEVGYSYVETETVNFWGGYILKGQKDEADNLYDDEQTWKNLVGEKLFNMAIDKNRKLEEELDTNLQDDDI